jgi:23S rRNA pseudouridine1911/1915/1917 synthase
MPLVERRWIVKPEQAGRADRVVAQMTQRSRAEVRGMFDHACVTLNESACGEAGQTVTAGDALAVRFDPKMRYHEKPKPRTDSAFGVVFEDEHLIVVDKAAHVLTVPSERSKDKSLVDAVTQHISRKGRPGRALVVHRLDRGVSGLLVLAKSSAVAGGLQSEIRARRMEREYVAIVSGIINPPERTFDTLLTTDNRLNRKSQRPDDDDEPDEPGERAITHYRTQHVSKDATVVRVNLETGRRHQIRVHFAEVGHPVLGDRRYRENLAFHPWWTPARLALHAARLAFTHPVTQEQLRFESPLPREFERFLQAKPPSRTRLK